MDQPSSSPEKKSEIFRPQVPESERVTGDTVGRAGDEVQRTLRETQKLIDSQQSKKNSAEDRVEQVKSKLQKEKDVRPKIEWGESVIRAGQERFRNVPQGVNILGKKILLLSIGAGDPYPLNMRLTQRGLDLNGSLASGTLDKGVDATFTGFFYNPPSLLMYARGPNGDDYLATYQPHEFLMDLAELENWGRVPWYPEQFQKLKAGDWKPGMAGSPRKPSQSSDTRLATDPALSREERLKRLQSTVKEPRRSEKK